MITTDQVNEFLRHVYTAGGAVSATLLLVGLSQGDITALGQYVHQIGDSVAAISAAVAAMIPIITSIYEAWTASRGPRIASIIKDPAAVAAIKRIAS